MQRRGGLSERPVKSRQSKGRRAKTAHVSVPELQEQLERQTRELKEAWEQQAATTELLQVISRSSFDLQTVLDTLTRSAAQLCEAELASIYRPKGDAFYWATSYGYPPELGDYMKNYPMTPGRGTAVARVLLGGRTVQISDVLADPDYANLEAQKLGGYRALLAVPLLREGTTIGVISLARRIPLAFTDKQIALVQNFAAQAVIAIENARLLNELRQRTDDLSESLEQQTATSDVLKVISSSRGELGPVFKAMLEKAVQVCGAKFGILFLSEGDGFHTTAMHNVPRAFAEKRERQPFLRPTAGSPLGRVMLTRQVAHISDIMTEQGYTEGHRPLMDLVELGGARTAVCVPMLNDNELVGAITIYQKEVRPFSDKQIELVTNFAAQAVIAIENARLLNELRQRTDDLSESLEQQTATSEVLRVISSSPGTLEPVFQIMLENATRLCEAQYGVLFLWEGDGKYRVGALHGASPRLADERRPGTIIRPAPSTVITRIAETKRAAQENDIQAKAAYVNPPPGYMAAGIALHGGARTELGVPMLKDDKLIGALVIYRREVRPFTDKQTALLANFAAQAVIAIENARLLNELRQRTHELATSLDDLRNTQDRLVQTQKLASLGQLTAGIAHEIKNPLNFVNNFSGISAELIDELQDTLKGPIDDKARAEIKELTNTLKGNLDKVVQHGKRADAIVKNMLLHSREGSSEHRLVDINALVEESLNLAYHGARAEKQGFNITLERSFDPVAEQADVFPQDITRVLLNLILNGFYAATKRKAEAGDGYEPTLMASTRSLGDRVEIKVRDNGTGIPPDVKEKIFNPFFTTKPAGEGTGLGLSISHDIIVKQHGGSIEVETELGEYTEFRIILPRRAGFVTASGAQS